MRGSRSTAQQYGGELALLNKVSTRPLQTLFGNFVVPLDPFMVDVNSMMGELLFLNLDFTVNNSKIYAYYTLGDRRGVSGRKSHPPKQTHSLGSQGC